jgi:hypothetical protein
MERTFMIRVTSLLCAGVVILATSFACAPAQTPPPPPPPMAAACNVNTFLGKVRLLSVPFAPAPGAAAPNGTPLPTNSPYSQGLIDAFNTASGAFQQQLCKLDQVYINQSICSDPDKCPVPGDSWGWSQSKPTIGKGRILALSAGLWSYATHQTPYADYETDLMQSVMPLSGANYSGANVEGFPLVVLSALAHEMGHILWYEVVTHYPGATRTYADPKSFCNGAFFQTSWSLVTAPPQWRVLLTPAQRYRFWGRTNWPNMHKLVPHVRDIDNPGTSIRAQLIYGLFAASQPWPSAFGAVAPDEDFVETYRFKILTSELNTPVTSVTITIPIPPNGPAQANVAADYTKGLKPDLGTKVKCVPDFF